MAKKCRVCKEKFEAFNSLQFTCGAKCAIEWAKKDIKVKKKREDKAFKAETRRLKETIKKKSKWLEEAQTEFNKFIRARDEGDACISCGRSTGCKVNAGHYKSVGAYPELRFSERNVHLQCEECNCHKSGNAIEYRIRLIQKIGKELVEWLEGPHEPKRYTIEEIKEIKQLYKDKYKQLINN